MRDQRNKPRSRFFRFGMRTMFVAVFLVACASVGYVWHLLLQREQQAIEAEQRDLRERQVIEAQFQDLRAQQAIEARLEELGSFCYWDEYVYSEPASGLHAPQWQVDLLGRDPNSKITRIGCRLSSAEQMQAVLKAAMRLPALESLMFNGTPDDPELPFETQGFHAVPGLRELEFEGVTLNQSTFAEIARMDDLETLYIWRCDLSQLKIDTFKSLPPIRNLSLFNCAVNPEHLPAISQVTSIWFLNFRLSSCGDTNLEYLPRLPILRFVDLSSTLVTDKAIPKLAGISSLEHLDISSNEISGVGMSAFAGSNLRVLKLSYTNITDACLGELIQCDNLEKLDVSGTKLTPAGILRLKQALPNTEITTDS